MKKFLTLTAIVALGLMSCTPGKQSKESIGDSIPNHADSIVSAAGDSRDIPRTLFVIDSLEQAGELSKVRTIFYRTIAYNMREEYRTSFALYEQLADIHITRLTDLADLECYIYSYNNYVRLLCEMKRYADALDVAFTVDKKLKAAGHSSFINQHDIAQIIGDCQLNLGQTKEAAISYQKSLEDIHKRLAKFNDPLDLRECQKTMNSIARTYISKELYSEAQPWIERQDSLYLIAARHPHRDTVYLDEMKAESRDRKSVV